MTTTMTSAAMPTPTWTQMLSDSAGVVRSLLATVTVSDTDDDDLEDINVDVATVGLCELLCTVTGGNRVFW